MKTIFKNIVLTLLTVSSVNQLVAITITKIENQMDNKRAFLTDENGTYPIEAKNKINITPFDLGQNKDITISTPLGVYVFESTEAKKINANLSTYSYSDESSQSDVSAEKVEIVIQGDGEITITGV